MSGHPRMTRAAVHVRDARALGLLEGGMTRKAVALELGVSVSAVRYMVSRERSRLTRTRKRRMMALHT